MRLKTFFNFDLFNSEDIKWIIDNQKKRTDKNFIVSNKKKI